MHNVAFMRKLSCLQYHKQTSWMSYAVLFYTWLMLKHRDGCWYFLHTCFSKNWLASGLSLPLTEFIVDKLCETWALIMDRRSIICAFIIAVFIGYWTMDCLLAYSSDKQS